MKRIKTIISFILINLSLSVTAQEVGVQAGKSNFNSFSVGVRGVHLYDLPAYRFDTQLSRDMKGLNGENTNFDLGFDLYVEKMFTPLLGLQLSYRNANISGANQVEYYESDFSEMALDALIIWSNLDAFRVDNKWNFYTKFGIALGSFKAEQFLIQDDAPDDNFDDDFWAGHMGLGVSYELNNYLRLELESNYNVAYNDGFDGFNNATGSDTYLTTALGIAYTFGSEEKKPMYAINYFGEGYLKTDYKTEPVQPVAPVLDTTRIMVLEKERIEADAKLKVALERIEQLENNRKEEKPINLSTGDKQPLVVYFLSNSSVLTQEARRELMAKYGSDFNQQQQLEITGYADKWGEKSYNEDLKQKRAASVKVFLIKLGFEANNLTIHTGYGTELRPQDEFLNRRVVIKAKSE